MTWKFDVVATRERRLFSRIIQTLDCQGVGIHSFAGETQRDEVHVTFVVSSQEDRTNRVEALLYRLEHVHGVSVRVTAEISDHQCSDE